MENMAGHHNKRQYWKHDRPGEADTAKVTGLDGKIYTMYSPTRPSETEWLCDEFDRISMVQLERARSVLGHRLMPRDLIRLRKQHGESATLIEEESRLGIFHIGGRCAELLAFALMRDDLRYDLQGVGTGAFEGSVFLIRSVSIWTQLACRIRREKKDRERQEKANDKDGRDKDRGQPAGAPADGAKASAFRTVNSGHWAASKNGPWAFGGGR